MSDIQEQRTSRRNVHFKALFGILTEEKGKVKLEISEFERNGGVTKRNLFINDENWEHC